MSVDIRQLHQFLSDERLPEQFRKEIYECLHFEHVVGYAIVPGRRRVVYFGAAPYYLRMPNLIFFGVRIAERNYLFLVAYDDDQFVYTFSGSNFPSGDNIPQYCCLGDNKETDFSLFALMNRFWLKPFEANYGLARDWYKLGYEFVTTRWKFINGKPKVFPDLDAKIKRLGL